MLFLHWNRMKFIKRNLIAGIAIQVVSERYRLQSLKLSASLKRS